jgi:hypothetical protein
MGAEPGSYPIRSIKYKKGELVVKQGDYGFSIYKIITGKVQVFKETQEIPVPLDVLGPGNLIGERVFFNRTSEVRLTSARALEDSELEVWHPAFISNEYEQLSTALKYIVDSALFRLAEMNNVMKELSAAEKKGTPSAPKNADAYVSQRAYYRKRVNIPCEYAPLKTPKDFRQSLKGRIFDISMTGLRMDVDLKNASVVSHSVGDQFRIKTVLPNDKPLEVTGEITFALEREFQLQLGVSFTRLSDVGDTKKNLGFFLLPA